jgi:hypothetical protein
MSSKSGGFKTTKNGINFENMTCNITNLIENGFYMKKNNTYWYLKKYYGTKIIRFIPPKLFKKYIFDRFGIYVYRKPDEVYIINDGNNWTIKIIEKKFQNVPGTIEDKLWAGPAYKHDYQMMFPEFKIEYIFVVNEFLAERIMSTRPKYKSLKKFLKSHNIKLVFGEAKNYFEYILNWILV